MFNFQSKGFYSQIDIVNTKINNLNLTDTNLSKNDVNNISKNTDLISIKELVSQNNELKNCILKVNYLSYYNYYVSILYKTYKI